MSLKTHRKSSGMAWTRNSNSVVGIRSLLFILLSSVLVSLSSRLSPGGCPHKFQVYVFSRAVSLGGKKASLCAQCPHILELGLLALSHLSAIEVTPVGDGGWNIHALPWEWRRKCVWLHLNYWNESERELAPQKNQSSLRRRKENKCQEGPKFQVCSTSRPICIPALGATEGHAAVPVEMRDEDPSNERHREQGLWEFRGESEHTCESLGILLKCRFWFKVLGQCFSTRGDFGSTRRYFSLSQLRKGTLGI